MQNKHRNLQPADAAALLRYQSQADNTPREKKSLKDAHVWAG